MSALSAELLYLFFDSANMHRWNDHLRPLDLTELDKQAHKASIAWILGKCGESEGRDVDWCRIIEDCMFSFIRRAVLTDLKPQVFHRVVEEKMEQVNVFVLDEFDARVPDSDPVLRGRLEDYLWRKEQSYEDRIVDAAHYLATRWEFGLIYDSNRSRYGISDTRDSMDQQIETFMDVPGVSEMKFTGDTFNFMDLIGQLRFQQRWARAPRIPRTTVLGHSLMVANAMYLRDIDLGIGGRQLYNDFYTGLFHDLPEVLTKDVITPIKMSVDGLADILEEYEKEQVECRIMPLLKSEWCDEFRFLVYEPFADVTHPIFGPRNGGDLKICDLFAAYMEAHVSRCYGIGSKALSDGENEIRNKIQKKGSGFGKGLMESLDSMRI